MDFMSLDSTPGQTQCRGDQHGMQYKRQPFSRHIKTSSYEYIDTPSIPQ